MPRSLSLECEWLDQPAAADSLERRTWARISLTVDGQSAARLWDRETQAERSSLYLPALPLAEWLLEHWWSLLYQPARSERGATRLGSGAGAPGEWLRSHCLRAAAPGLLLPWVCFYSNGPEVVVEWTADEPEHAPHMPGRFLDSGRAVLPRYAVEEALWDFVSVVAQRLADTDDERAESFRAHRDALDSIDEEEAKFCRAAGRLGLCPYIVAAWDPQLVALLESDFGGEAEGTLAADCLESVLPEKAVASWNWAATQRTEFALGSAPPRDSAPRPMVGEHPAKYGYRLAEACRQGRNLADLAQTQDVAAAIGRRFGFQFASVNRNHLPDSRLHGEVGWDHQGRAVFVGPIPPRSESQRFLAARAAYHSLASCSHGPRLVTAAPTWDQQASRAFAAELLAPADEIRACVAAAGEQVEREFVVAEIAKKFAVSRYVIDLQSQNWNIPLPDPLA